MVGYMISFKKFLDENRTNEYVIDFYNVFNKNIYKLPDKYVSSKNIITILELHDEYIQKNIFKKVYLEMYFRDTLLFKNI